METEDVEAVVIDGKEVRYPRRQLLRRVMRFLARRLLHLLADFRVEGEANVPREGPLLVVTNHFSYLDPVITLAAMPWPLEFIGGAHMPTAPPWVRWLPKVWGYYPVYRGTGSRFALMAAEVILRHRGVIGIYPEGGSWAAVLRPPRPGTAFLASRTGARLLPVAQWGVNDIFPALRRGKRARVRLRFGKPFGPFYVEGRGRERRRQLEAIGHTIMQHIAELLPPALRGHYADDPAIREAARPFEAYPWD